MGKLLFEVDDDLLAIIAHCKKGKCRIPYTDKISKEPGMWLVKDSGVYLMPASPGLTGKDEKRPLVVYAKGHDPNKGRNVWAFDREVCGGDDFAEFIPFGNFGDRAKKGMKLEIDLTPNAIAIELFTEESPKLKSKPKPKPKPKKQS